MGRFLRALTVALCAFTALAGSGSHGAKAADAQYVTARARLAMLHRAQVWVPTDVSTMNLRDGPPGDHSFAPGATVACDYAVHARNGRTPKFHCTLANGKNVKVKYGAGNSEVYGAVIATRLLWALGFGADAQYPVIVVCRGCSRDPWHNPSPAEGTVTFDPAIIEDSFNGKPIETHDSSGWTWDELDRVDASRGGAASAQRDALTLLAVMMQHTDNKAEQQRLVCLDRSWIPGQTCERPFMYLHDVGLTFGKASLLNGDESGVNFGDWAKHHIWKDRDGCVGNLRRSVSGTLGDPEISEAGRAFLADLLVQLTDDQLRDLFTVARVERRSNASVESWVMAFKRTREQIVQHHCPA